MTMTSNVVALPKRKPTRKASNKTRLTEPKLKSMKAPAKGEIIIWDSECVGLGVRLTAKGARTFIVKKWNPEKRQSVKKSLGPVGSITLNQARSKAWAMLGSDEADLNTTARRQDADSKTVGQVFDMTMSDKGDLKSVEKYRYFWRTYVEPTGFHDLRIRDVSVDDIRTMVIDPLRKGRGKKLATSDHVRAVLSMTWKFGMANGYTAANPVQAIPLVKTAPRERVLTDDEVVRLNAALDEEGEPWADYFRVLMGTAQRGDTVRRMKWADLKLEEGEGSPARWNIPATDVKGGKATTCTLPTATVAVLQRRREADGGTWVFPSNRDPSKHITSPQKAWNRVCAGAGIQGATAHDIRRTIGTNAGKAGHSAHQIAALLGHRSIQSAKAYVHLEGAREDVAEEATLLLAEGVGKKSGYKFVADEENAKLSAHIAELCQTVLGDWNLPLVVRLTHATQFAAVAPMGNADAFAVLLADVGNAIVLAMPEKLDTGSGIWTKGSIRGDAAELARRLAMIANLTPPHDTTAAARKVHQLCSVRNGDGTQEVLFFLDAEKKKDALLDVWKRPIHL